MAASNVKSAVDVLHPVRDVYKDIHVEEDTDDNGDEGEDVPFD